MIVEIDLNDGATLTEPAVFTAFHATAATGDASLVGAAMGPAGHAAGDGHVWVSIQWLRDTAGDADGPEWAEGFDAMVSFAASKGWLDGAETHIRAHIEVVPGA